MHRASGTSFAELRALAKAQTGSCRSAVDLSCRDRSRGRGSARTSGANLELLSTDVPNLEAQLGAHHAVFPLSTGNPPSHLHHQQRGSTASLAAQDHQEPRRLSPSRRSLEVIVSRAAPSSEEVDHARASLARCTQPLHHPVAGTHALHSESRRMNILQASKWMVQRKGNFPLPLQPHPQHQPQNQNLVVYTKDWTYPLVLAVRHP